VVDSALKQPTAIQRIAKWKAACGKVAGCDDLAIEGVFGNSSLGKVARAATSFPML
jgi:hypothetical protein